MTATMGGPRHASTDRDVRGSASYFEMIEDFEKTLDEASDYLGRMAPALQDRIVKKLKKEGVVGRGLLGSTEGRAAKKVCDPIAQAAECLAWAVQSLKESEKMMDNEVLLPIQQAQEAYRGEDPFEIG